MKRPLIPLTACLIGGILSIRFINIPFVFIYALSILSLAGSLLLIRKPFLSSWGICLSCYFFGAALVLNFNFLEPNNIAKIDFPKSGTVTLKGFVVSEPQLKKRKQVFKFKVTNLITEQRSYNLSGRILVNLYKPAGVEFGQELILNGKIYKPFVWSTNKPFNYRKFLKRQRIYYILSISKTGKVTVTGNYSNILMAKIFKLKGRIKHKIYSNLSPPTANVVSAMILGVRTEVPAAINRALMKSGTVHVLAVSGLHVGMVAVIIMAFLSLISVPYKTRYLLVIIALIFYCLMTGARISVVRSTIMAAIFLTSFLVDRDYDVFSALSLAAFVILCLDPNQIYSVGFQLSFLSVFFIFTFAKKIVNFFSRKILRRRWLKSLILSFSVSVAAWLGTAGLIIYCFNIFTPIAIVANLIIVPLLFAIVSCGFIFLIFGFFIPALTANLALTCEVFTVLLFKINNCLISLPGSYWEFKSVDFRIVIIYYVGLFLVYNYSFLKTQIRKFLGW